MIHSLDISRAPNPVAHRALSFPVGRQEGGYAPPALPS